MSKILGIILLFIMCIGLAVIPYQLSITKAQETFTKPLLFIKKYTQGLYVGGYEGVPPALLHVDIVDNTDLNYSEIKNYKVIYISSSLSGSTDINWTALKLNLVPGQVVILKDAAAKNGLVNLFSASLGYAPIAFSNQKIVANGSSDVIGWISGKEFYDPILEGLAYSYINMSATTIPVPYQVVAYITNGTYTFPALIYIEDNGVKYFFIVLKYYSNMALFFEYHLMALYASDGFALGSMPHPFMIVTHIHDYIYTEAGVQGFINFINYTKVPVVWLMTPNVNTDLNKQLVDKLKQLGWLNKYVFIGIHGYYHDNYNYKTYDEILSNISAAVKMIREYYGVEPVLEWGTPGWTNNENVTKALAKLGFYAELEYSFPFSPYNTLDWKDFHGRKYDTSELALFTVRKIFTPTSNTTPDPRTLRIDANTIYVALMPNPRSGVMYDTIYWHTHNLDPSFLSFHPGINETYWALGHIYNIYTTASEMAAHYLPDVLKVYPDIGITYNSDGSITLTSNMTCWVKIKGTWWHKDGLPTFHGTDGYGSWTIALLKPGENVFYKTIKKPSIEYVNAKVLSLSQAPGKIDLVVNAPKNYRVVIRIKMTWEPQSVYVYYKRLPMVYSKALFDSASYDCWYYDPLNKLLYVKVTAHSDVPIQVYSTTLSGKVEYTDLGYICLTTLLVLVLVFLFVYVRRTKH